MRASGDLAMDTAFAATEARKMSAFRREVGADWARMTQATRVDVGWGGPTSPSSLAPDPRSERSNRPRRDRRPGFIQMR